jgi:hypothetical protein
MKRSKFISEPIVKILKEFDEGKKIEEIIRE